MTSTLDDSIRQVLQLCFQPDKYNYVSPEVRPTEFNGVISSRGVTRGLGHYDVTSGFSREEAALAVSRPPPPALMSCLGQVPLRFRLVIPLLEQACRPNHGEIYISAHYIMQLNRDRHSRAASSAPSWPHSPQGRLCLPTHLILQATVTS